MFAARYMVPVTTNITNTRRPHYTGFIFAPQARDQQNNIPLLGRPLQVDFAQLDDKFTQSLTKATDAPSTASKRKEPAPASVAAAVPEITNKRAKKNTTSTDTSEFVIDEDADGSSTVRPTTCPSLGDVTTRSCQAFLHSGVSLYCEPCMPVAREDPLSHSPPVQFFADLHSFVLLVSHVSTNFLYASPDSRRLVPKPSAKSK
jgi:hypothetical protein